ncbi:MAG: GNAT family N-acetyltransferase [Burkholderiaceae bacterium]|nr:GNAT family N-acetyltransferase [Burkholderiaceae bacterium]
MSGSQLRDCTENDLPAIQAIYAHHVLHGTASFEIDPPDLKEIARRHAEVRGRGLPYLVAEADGVVLGYAYANFFRARPAYRFTLEDSIYIAPDALGRGVGRALLPALADACEAVGCRQLLAVIGDSANVASIGLHAACGFRFSGVIRNSGWKFGRWLDTVFMQRALGEGERSAPLTGPAST